MIIIDYVSHRAGLTWDKPLAEYCKQKGIRCYPHSDRTDVLIGFHFDSDVYPIGYIYAFECKFEDLHNSLCGKGIAGELEYELKKQYLPFRPTVFTRVRIIIAGPVDPWDLAHLSDLCDKYDVVAKFYYTQENAIKGMLSTVANFVPKRDLDEPSYINGGNIKMDEMMLRLFPGNTEVRIAQNKICLKDHHQLTPEQIFNNYGTHLLLNSNLRRLWCDWWYNGIEPKDNVLGKDAL